MKNKKNILLHISIRRFEKRIKRLRKKCSNKNYTIRETSKKKNYPPPLNSDDYFELGSILCKKSPINLKHLVNCKKSPLYIKKLYTIKPTDRIFIPENFSITDNPKESFRVVQCLISSLLLKGKNEITLDYSNCKNIDLDTQVFIDICIKEIFDFYKSNQETLNKYLKPLRIRGRNIKNSNVGKILFSVGSPAIHQNKTIDYEDIIPYRLCCHTVKEGEDSSGAKEIDTTSMADYVKKCLALMNKSLTSEKLEDLCNVIGETLINAEEHATTKCRLSIGYFQEKKEQSQHFGLFNLVIMNFGDTIYEKFKNPDCPVPQTVQKMKKLSKEYTEKKFLKQKEFEEETLWTLYSLQEGVTSIPDKQRGTGSIQFIKSFFNIKGSSEVDNISKMVLYSGKTKIIFDGTYQIQKDKDNYSVMTFNNSGDIHDKPDNKFVTFVDQYFPGTVISAKILLNDDDLKNEQ